MKIPPLHSPVRVDWLDSVSQPGWQYVRPSEKPNVGLRLPMQTRGVLIASNAVSLTVATTVAPLGPEDSKTGYLDVLTIPVGAVVGIRVIS